MVRSVLVRAAGDEYDAVSCATACSVVRLFGAHLEALHVRLDPVEAAVAMSAEGTAGPLLQGIVDRLQQEADEREATARSRFTAFCSREALPLVTHPSAPATGPSASFHVETGQEPRWMATYGLTADLAVAARGAPNADAVARSTLEALLLETGRPLLIPAAAAPAPNFADRMAIAWKPTAQAARAVAAAMPFLARAKTVSVLTVEEGGERRDDAARLIDYLGWHGVAARSERLTAGPDGAAAALLAAAEAHGGLLVMGGYGHSRLREWVFGGFTQHVLNHADVPVLIAH